ncbi:BREX-2 system adenine-specific DNA-methyltransferase PglX [Thiorhodococcus mannitoliphagus]|uniref:site-specific DNA-methyltransferase (adenine-specific) n=1 Tax=Thiorhodococcus mannitoliphagus TaxID=329406 RepID=A0A6P1DT93_9GAMM|nr:BREX-2 system adenine-specific DNA-methyltransferase PglX [Thiorhodococcus mannitoliphagus]NEX20423.1 BREX-2 system adenine-specific DNA-methyltransferase PglX [Thiorhodococcus mannitoliphagus]
MIHPKHLLADLQSLLPKLEQDILAYSQTRPELEAHLQSEYAKAKEASRTAEHFVAWREAQITQAAAAWVLTSVFVRFLEDNGLLDMPMLSGPADSSGQGALQQAKDRMTVYFNAHPTHAERDYLLAVFTELETLPALGELLDRAHNPLWRLPLSADGAKALIDFFQRLDPATGAIVHDFTDDRSDGGWDTRFLGDLYQDLSESVRKRYALLQTPEFVERFILDYSLEPAKAAFGLPGLKLIDPTCGSGHFLLTGFERLFDEWQRREPATNARALAQRALDAIHGVDINPYAVAIARFRLLIAAMKAAGSERLKDAPDFHFNLAVGDSLLLGPRHEWEGQGNQGDLLDDPLAHCFEVEDRDKLERILGQRYQVVVGNPPYITVKDKALNQAYRVKYPTCHRQYSLGVPFTERFFDLTLPAEDNRPAGFVGLITANSFMKREFGKKLIEAYLPRKDLTHVIDTSGAYIPGHGTPTVILFGRNRKPEGERVRAVLGIRGEPSTPEDAAQGLVWRSIVELLERPGSESAFVSVVDQERGLYARHPWSVGGGGATQLMELIERQCTSRLADAAEEIGAVSVIRADDIYDPPLGTRRGGLPRNTVLPHVVGQDVRDWSITSENDVIYPYDESARALKDIGVDLIWRLWPFRILLETRIAFGKTQSERGLRWFEYSMLFTERFLSRFLVVFPNVATHNHFALIRSRTVVNSKAPVIKLPAGASEDDHLALLGLLNSSTAMFWMKQVFHGKGQGGIGQESRAEWEEFREFTGTGMKSFPVPADPESKARTLATALDHSAQRLADQDPAKVLSTQWSASDLSAMLDQAQAQSESIARQMIALQEELDWLNYRLYGLTDADLCYDATPPEIRLGERPFEILLARRLAAGETETTWFQRHNSTPITEIPAHWPDDYRALTERRLQAIADNRWIRLVEQPEYKRRWNREPWEGRQRRALRDWLLDHLEGLCHAPELLTVAQLAERARHDAAFQQVAALYTGSDTFDARALVAELVESDQVPQMAAARYKPKAMPKFRAWQETWDQQRAEDAIDARTMLDPADPAHLTEDEARALKASEIGDIPLPPKYAAADFRKPSYWGLRGKLDVPKERFFSLPGCERPGDTSLVIGWAGLDHLSRAQAIAAWYLERKEQDGWDAARLTPLLVALDELTPWLKQWHNALDPEFGERLGDYYAGFLLEELRQLELSRDALLAWEPAAVRRGRGR